MSTLTDHSLWLGAPTAAREMARAASHFLATLDPERRVVAQFDFDDDERYQWNYRPDGFRWNGRTVWHEGLRLINMTGPQQQAALSLLDAGLSSYGADRTRAIMTLERALRETERVTHWEQHVVRDPELYAFAIFGEPGNPTAWAWRAGGHHLGVHFTVVDGDLVAPTPLFFGANPAEVRHGPDPGLRTLPEEEDRARDLLHSLDPARRAVAIVSATAPRDILTDAYRGAPYPLRPPRGVSFGVMSADERERLRKLIRLYVDRLTEEIATTQWRRIEQAGLDCITFAWAGGSEPGQPHYYAVKGPTFLIEYDKTQDEANHIHSVFRDVTNDWGEDLLAAHYLRVHHASASL